MRHFDQAGESGIVAEKRLHLQARTVDHPFGSDIIPGIDRRRRTMKFLKKIPMFGYLFVLINIFILLGKPTIMSGVLIKMTLHAGSDPWILCVGDIFVILGLICLTIQVFKATRTSSAEVVDHIISTLIFILFLIEFIVVKSAGNSTFFILMLMALLAVIAGFTITISTARRDVTLDRDGGPNIQGVR
jgi:hypothetical protein